MRRAANVKAITFRASGVQTAPRERLIAAAPRQLDPDKRRAGLCGSPQFSPYFVKFPTVRPLQGASGHHRAFSVRSWFKGNLLGQSGVDGVRAGLALGERDFTLALARRPSGQKPVLEYCARHEITGGVEHALASVIHKLRLARAPLSAVVGAEDYQLVQVEAPEVLPSELRAAVRWRLRDVISFHIDDAVVDVFEIPDQSRRSQAKMMFAVAARSSAVQRLAAAAAPVCSGFDAIDIPELCLRNIAALLPQDQRGAALLVLAERSAQLLLTRQGVLYLARRIELARGYELSLDGADGDGVDAGALALELQRSLDYYESHFDQTPIGDLVIAPQGERSDALAAALASETSLKISMLNVRDVLSVSDAVQTDLSGACLTAIGAALRVDSVQL